VRSLGILSLQGEVVQEKKETLQLPAKPEQHMLETDISEAQLGASGTAIFGLE
jgi:hypothetical protein